MSRSFFFRCLLACAPAFMGHISIAAPLSQYTYETVSAYAESWEYAIRWGAGKVTIADNTGILQKNPKILELLNANLGDTKLVLVNDEKAKITIKWVDQLPAPYASACATTSNTLKHDGVEIDFSIIRVRNNNSCMGEKSNNGDILMLHELGHALGFAKHAKEDDVMSVHDPAWSNNEVNITTLQSFLAGLYALTPGQKIPTNQRMYEPVGTALRYHIPIEEKGPLFVLKPEKPLPETHLLSSLPQFKKVEKRASDGTLTVEFIAINDNLGSNKQNLSSDIVKSSTDGRVIEIDSKSTKRGTRARFETIGPGR